MEGEKEGEKHQCVVASHMPPAGDNLARSPGMCPDWESKWQPLSLAGVAQWIECRSVNQRVVGSGSIPSQDRCLACTPGP